MLEGLKKLPLLGKALSRGQERAGELAAKLLTDERLVVPLQAALSAAQKARQQVEGALQKALRSFNVAQADEIEELRRRLAHLEKMLDQLSQQHDRGGGSNGHGEQH